jgi:ribosome-associated protein
VATAGKPDLRVTKSIVIPADELGETFSRAQGPGGQNVNKVASKVELRWNLAGSRALGEADRTWLLERLATHITASGDLVVRASRTRDQVRNRAEARARLVELVRAALVRPKERVATRPGRRAVERRLAGKKRRAQVKQARRSPDD